MSDSEYTSTSEEEYSSDECDYSKNGDHLINSVLKSRYLLLKKIGYGSFSSVWFIYDWEEQKYYAMKIYNDIDYDEGLIEIKTLKMINKLNTPYLMKMKEYFIYQTKKGNKKLRHPCIIMELMVGSLYELLKYQYNKEGIPINIIEKIVPQILEGIKNIHSLEIIHGDIKPENILIKGYRKEINEYINIIKDLNIHKLNKTKSEICIYLNKLFTNINCNNENFIDEEYLNNIEIRITDFGSIIHKKNFSTEEIQTRYYRAPEILLSLKHGFPCDIWALGCLFFELITGKILFDPDKDEIRNRDYCHIFLIASYLGNFPKYMIDNSPLKKDFFKKYKFKHDELIKEDFIKNEIEKKIKDSDIIKKYLNLIFSMLEISISKRYKFIC
jgi:serine/threonine-protein kinase SRPK3